MRQKILILFLLINTLIGCSSLQRTIDYHYTDNVNDLIREAINYAKKSYIKPRNKGTLFVKMDYCNGATVMIFNYIENMPKPIRTQILISNRYLIIDKAKIPIIFGSDNGNAVVRELGTNHGIIGGYILEFNALGELVLKGLS